MLSLTPRFIVDPMLRCCQTSHMYTTCKVVSSVMCLQILCRIIGTLCMASALGVLSLTPYLPRYGVAWSGVEQSLQKGHRRNHQQFRLRIEGLATAAASAV